MTGCEKTGAIISNDYADYITDFIQPAGFVGGENLDYCFVKMNENYNSVYLNRAQIPETNVVQYSYYSIPKLYGIENVEEDILNLIETGIYPVQQEPLALTGKGVVVGFIDTGIQYTNPAFLNEFGTTRITAIWDQGIEGAHPEGFYYGSEYKKEQINQAIASENPREIVPSWDEVGHGTAMAAVAVGSNTQESNYLGAAPESELVVVKLKEAKQYLKDYYLLNETAKAYQENDIMLACNYLLGFAKVFEKPLVICIGIGTNYGDHSGNSPLGLYLNELSRTRNIAVVASAGNEGNAAHHYVGKLMSSGDMEQASELVEIRVGNQERGFLCELWGDSPNAYEISIVSPGGERIPRISFNYQDSKVYSFVYEDTLVTIDVILVEQLSGQQLIVIRFDKPTVGVWNIEVFYRGRSYLGEFHLWLPLTQFLSSDTVFLNPDPYTTITEPAMADGVMTVGSYNGGNGSFAFFSGRGFTRQDVVKPDLVAPGIGIDTIGGKRDGTSLSAAFAAGAVADFLQWAVIEGNALLVSGIEIKGYFIRGATREEGISYPSKLWGYGKLNLAGVFESLRR